MGSGFGFEFQLAIKMLRDPVNYDLGEWLKISERAGPLQGDVDQAADAIKLSVLRPRDYPIF